MFLEAKQSPQGARRLRSHIQLERLVRLRTQFDLFHGWEIFIADVSMWDVSHVTNMLNMFEGSQGFNQDICQWNLRKVTAMAGVF
ncbi:BspA family leucine-rich repeat surface protein [archaeon]|nr:MAG: BspA family leucine-rich repeat surface protein [archaeon]